MDQTNYNKIVTYIIENQEKFYRLAFSYVRNEDDALDIIQNAIYKALEKQDTIRNIDFIKTWFYRMLLNESINFIRKKKKELPTDEFLLEKELSFEQDGKDQNNLFEEINKLPFDTQHVIKLRFYEELFLQEIAEITKVNLSTVKSRLYRGLKNLKQEVIL